MTRGKSGDLNFDSAMFEFLLRAEAAKTAKLEAEADTLGERVATAKENRTLRFGIAIAALVLMAAVEVVAVVLVIVNYLFPNKRREYA